MLSGVFFIMADNKKSVLLYCDIIHTVKELTDEEAGKLFKHYLSYVNDLNPMPPDKLTQIVFEPIKQNLKRDLKKWESTLNMKSEGGRKGMESRWGKKDNIVISNDNIVKEVITPITVKDTVTVIVTDTVKDTVTVKDIKKEFKETPIPSENEFLEYCQIELKSKYQELEFSLKAKYEAWKDNNWKDGNGSAIKNWKLKLKNVFPYLKSFQLIKSPVESQLKTVIENRNEAHERIIARNNANESGNNNN